MSVKNVRGRWHITFSQKGRRIHRVMPKGSTRPQAQERETQLRQELTNVLTLGKKPSYTVGDAIEKYLLEEMKGAKSEVHTTHHALVWEPWATRPLTEAVTCAEEYKAEARGKGLTGSTIRNRLAVLRRACNLAYRRWNWLSVPLAEKIESPAPNPPKTGFYSRDEVAKILRHVRAHRLHAREIAAAIVISLYAGLRRSEICAIKPDDFCDGPEPYLTLPVQKNGQVSRVPIMRKIRWAVKVAPFRDISVSSLSYAVADACNGRFHSLRHSFGSWLLNAGEPIEVVSKLLRHSSVSITSRVYSHILVGTMRASVERGMRKRA